MHSTVLKHLIAASALALITIPAVAASAPPKVLQEPIFGMRYEVAKARFEQLPAQAISSCETLVDNQYSRAVWYVYAKAVDSSGRTYYVVNGFEIRLGVPEHLKYDTEGLGVVFFTDRGACTILDIPRQVFNDRIFGNEMSQQTLRQLALDAVRRLQRAFGGPDKLKAELRNQHINGEGLPPELQEALRPYLD